MKKTYTTSFTAVALAAFVLSMSIGREAYAEEKLPRSRAAYTNEKKLPNRQKRYQPAAIGTVCDTDGKNCHPIGSINGSDK